MQYCQFIFDQLSDELIALLSLLPFESFEEKEIENKLIGYAIKRDCTDSFYHDIQVICDKFKVTFKKLDVEDINWNATWESSFDPVVVDNFCTIKASFHDFVPDTTYTIIIDPKMAFGTGHHETTFMMLEAMSSIDFTGKKVLDFGCGTGVLSIMSEFLGAVKIDAIDIEKESYKNTIENATINRCQKITTVHGTIDLLKDKSYDIILANINRNVLLDCSGNLYELCNENGTIILSGILREDEIRVLDAYHKAGFNLVTKKEKGTWLAFIFTKKVAEPTELNVGKLNAWEVP